MTQISSGSHGVPDVNLFDLYDVSPGLYYQKVLTSFANKWQQNSNAWCKEDYIPQIIMTTF